MTQFRIVIKLYKQLSTANQNKQDLMQKILPKIPVILKLETSKLQFWNMHVQGCNVDAVLKSDE